MNHKRGRPKSLRGGCLLCKPWKAECAPPGVRDTVADRRAKLLSADELEGTRVPERIVAALRRAGGGWEG